MVNSLTSVIRDLSPVEHLVVKGVCNGLSNSCISEHTHYSVKTVENIISRSARALGATSTPNTNLRVLLTVLYRLNFGEIESLARNLTVKDGYSLGPAA